MNKLKSAVLVGGAALTIGAVGAGGTHIYAMSGSGHGSSGASYHQTTDEFDARLASELASRFQLENEEVASVISDVRDQLQEERDKWKYDKLQNELEAGEITQEQYETLKAKFQNLDELRDKLDETNQSRDELKRQLIGDYHELKKYMKEENIHLHLYGAAHAEHDGGQHSAQVNGQAEASGDHSSSHADASLRADDGSQPRSLVP